MTTQEARLMLGERVRRRRESLGLTIDAAAAIGQISAVTWSRVEAAKTVRGLTYAAVDRALRWSPGGARSILDGGEPQAIPGGAVQPELTVEDDSRSLEEILDNAERISDQIQALLEQGKTLTDRQRGVVRRTAQRLIEDLREADG